MKYGEMTLSIEWVTPTIAKRWLDQNIGNRAIRRGLVQQYAKDMQHEKWERKPVAICFDDESHLGNGQHTLSAIVESGVSQELLIARNCPKRSIAMMDRGKTRTLSDVANFLGTDFSDRKASIAKIIKWGPGHRYQKSFDELFEAYLEHSEVIDFSVSNLSKAVGLSAPVLAICAKAAYTSDRTKISRFLHVLKEGIPSDESEIAAVRLRDFARSLRGAHSGLVRVELYGKAMTALRAFLDGRPIQRVNASNVELFDVPSKAANSAALSREPLLVV